VVFDCAGEAVLCDSPFFLNRIDYPLVSGEECQLCDDEGVTCDGNEFRDCASGALLVDCSANDCRNTVTNNDREL